MAVMGIATGAAGTGVATTTSAPARLAEQLNMNVLLTVANRAWLWRHPGLMQLPDANGSGSVTMKTSILGLGGADAMALVAENDATAPLDVALSSFPVAVERYALERGITDLNDAVDSVGLNVEAMAADMVNSAYRTFTELVAIASGTFTDVVGTTGVQMVTDDAYDASYSLERRSVDGPYTGLLDPVQWTHLRESLRSEGGAVQFDPATAELLKIKGQGFKGNFIGIDWYAVPGITDDATDYFGGVFGQNGIAYREASVTRIPGVGAVQMATPIYAALDYSASTGAQQIVGNYHVGVSISASTAANERGVTIQSGN